MAGVKGRSGRKANEQPFRYALREKLDELDPTSGRKRLVQIAGKLVEEAEKGEAWAVKELMDRVDGKPKQQTELTGTGDGGAIKHEHTSPVELLEQFLAAKSGRQAGGAGED